MMPVASAKLLGAARWPRHASKLVIVPPRDEFPEQSSVTRLSTVVYEALDAVVSAEVRGGIIERALEHARAPIVPDEHAALLRFIDGPFRQAAVGALGAAHAERVVDEIRAALRAHPIAGPATPCADELRSGVAPTSTTPSDGPVSSAVRPWVGIDDIEARRGNAALAAARTPGHLRAGAPALLVVDDDPGYRNSVARLLGLEGYRVSEAGDAEQALALCRQQRMDVIVTDYQLIETTGTRLAERIAAALGEGRPEFICITALVPPPAPTAMVRWVLRKDSGVQALLDAVAAALASRTASRPPER